MINKNELIIILEQLEEIWDIAKWLKKIVIISDDDKILKTIYVMMRNLIKESKNKLDKSKLDDIKMKMKKLKEFEEKTEKQEDIEKFIDQYLSKI